MIEVVHIVSEQPGKMALVEDKDMIQTLPAHTAQKALTHGIGSRGTDRSLENSYPACCGDASNLETVLVVVIANEAARSLLKRRCLTELLGDPVIRWMPGHLGVNYFPGTELKNKEREDRPKPEIGDLEELAGLDLVRVVVEEGGPDLTLVLRWPSLSPVHLDRPFPHSNAHFEQFSSDPLRSPQAICGGHLDDQRPGLFWQTRLGTPSRGLGLPDRAKTPAVPA